LRVFPCSGVQELLRPTQIKAVLGLYKISAWQHSAIDKNEIDTSSQAYEVAVAKIIPHPGYDCTKPDNDIGNNHFYYFLLSSKV
jgi:hypothetical protein